MRPIIIVFFMLCANVLVGQDFFVISGKVSDANNGEPLRYAHVGISERGIGTTTGMDGSFVLKVPNYFRQSTLIVSYVGYNDYRRAIQTVKSPITIRMKASPTDLTEVVVMSESSIENIIRKAANRIPDNYSNHPITNLAFYRESRTDSENEYIYMAEGVLNVYKKSYRNDKEGQVSLVQGRQVILQPEKVTSANFTSGHLAAHRFDFVKYREDFIDEKYFDDYAYVVEKITTYQDRPVYVIGFDRAEDGRGRMRGRVFIDTLSYAFLRAEFEIRPEGLQKYNDYPLYSGNWNANSYVVNYRKIGDQWFFGDALREGIYRDGGTYSNEVMMTEINPERSKPIPYAERLDREDAFLRSTGEYDPDFWNDYNTTPLSQGLQESVLQIQNDQKASEVFDSAFMAKMERLQDSLRLVQSDRFSEIGLNEDIDISDLSVGDMIRLRRQLQELEDEEREERERNRWRLEAAVGAGTHLLSTQGGDMRIRYLEGDEGETILELNDQLQSRELEPIYHADLRIYFRQNYFFTWNISRDLWNSFYRERSLGFGASYNLSKQRPVFLRMMVQESRLRYARLLGDASNDFGDFRADDKKFNSDKVNVFYGSQTHNLRFSLELAIELNPRRDIFVRGSYLLPFDREEHIYLRERNQLFRKKARVPLSNRTPVEFDGEPFNGRITQNQAFVITAGIVFK